MRPRLEMKHALAEIEHRALRGMRHRHLDRQILRQAGHERRERDQLVLLQRSEARVDIRPRVDSLQGLHAGQQAGWRCWTLPVSGK
jgi:hypothetical protein